MRTTRRRLMRKMHVPRTIIGKALVLLEKDVGEILVLLGLQ